MSGKTDPWLEILSDSLASDDARVFRRLVRRARQLEEDVGPPTGLSRVRVMLLGGATSEILEGPLWLAMLAAGIGADLRAAPYDQVLQEMLDPESETAAFSPRVAIVVNTPFNLPYWPEPGCRPEEADRLAERVCRYFLKPCAHLHERCGTEIILCNFHPLPQQPIGNLGAKVSWDANNFIRRVNVRLGDLAPPYVHLNDVAAMAERRGLDSWFDERLWYEAKQPISPTYVPEFAKNTAAIVAAILGRSRKCLVVDLDGTLWGGIIGDDGVEGIILGEGDARGEAFKAFQQYLRKLRQRGVLLAVCSKNQEDTALLPFEKHPEMVLARDDFVAFKANWSPKSENLRAIAAELDLGLEAFVFLDENPAEREEVRLALPEVAVPEISDDPADFAIMLDRGRYFEVSVVTEEDRQRSELYRARGAARVLETESTDISQFLTSLEMKAQIRVFEPISIARIVQLVNKSNQFNLTTKRMTRAEVEESARDSSVLTLTVRLADRFGDHGLISVLAGRFDDKLLDIDLWLMSCRVLKRGVERLLLNEVVRAARARGIGEIRGTFIPSGRNELVRGHYSELGLAELPSDGRTTRWTLTVDDFKPLDTFIATDEESEFA